MWLARAFAVWSFDPNDIALTPGDSYALLLSTVNFVSGDAPLDIEQGSGSPLGGEEIVAAIRSKLPALANADLAFSATFTPTTAPTPGSGLNTVPDGGSTASLLGLSLLGVCVASRANRLSSLLAKI